MTHLLERLFARLPDGVRRWVIDTLTDLIDSPYGPDGHWRGPRGS